jgi:hypothetical protein
MHELSRYLFMAGGLPFLLLGLAHAFTTPRDVGEAKGLSPADGEVARAMSRTTILLTRRTNMWLAWVGFNFSHALGAVFFGVAVLVIARSHSSFAAQAGLFGPLAIAVASAYLVLAINYWFRTPIAGCAVSLALFVSSWVLSTFAAH